MKAIWLSIKRNWFAILTIIAGIYFIATRKQKEIYNEKTIKYINRISKINCELDKLKEEKVKKNEYNKSNIIAN